MAIDLKKWDEKHYILCMIDTKTRYIHGSDIKDKQSKTVLRALHKEWLSDMGIPAEGFFLTMRVNLDIGNWQK